MSIDSVKVRMYRHGFGDCFLLQFFKGTTRSMTMLIDCGLKHNDKVPGVSLKSVVQDIKKTLKGTDSGSTAPTLDVLVVTHEHWDHVSGFHPDQGHFDDINIDKIWMAWTESPHDREAVRIRQHLHHSIKALQLANGQLKKSSPDSARFFETHIHGEALAAARLQFGETLERITEFFGPLALKTPSGISLKDKYRISVNTRTAMEHLKGLAVEKTGIQYFYPGDLIQLPDLLPGMRIYVLGPPKNALLNKDKPSAGLKKEVYFGMDNNAMIGFVNGLLAKGDADAGSIDDGSPFINVDMIPANDAQADAFFQTTYFDKKGSWRTIEEDWLQMAGALAMQLDNDTNNTSLVLAMEFMESGKVLLFPGDAQVGNWLSWHDLEWEVKNGNRKEKRTVEQLLENTVLYKAGHHLSHNATLKKEGLELMKSEELVALVPEKEDQYNGIPYEPLRKRLDEKTKGRCLFSADAHFPAEAILTKKPEGLGKREWEAFKAALTIDKKFIEITIHA